MNKKIVIPIAAAIVLVVGLFWILGSSDPEISAELEQSLLSEDTNLLESGRTDQIRSFYASREFESIWLDGNGLSAKGKHLLEQIEDSKYDGLQPSDYHLEEIIALSSNPKKDKKKFRNLSDGEKVRLELLLTDGFFMLAHDLEKGKVNPSALDSSWRFEEKKTDSDYLKLLEDIADGGSVDKAFAKLYPTSDLYAKGREAIKELYEIQQTDTLEWDFARVDGAIKVGEKHPAIPILRKRLVFWDFLKPYDADEPTLFDSTMFAGLQKYQASNGMKPDGVIGALVAESLNKSPQDLIDIASVNMERLRWMPEIDWAQEMVLVNVANYQLDYLQDSDTAFTAKVIVGKEYNESPSFAAPMSYIVFSPYWNVPPSITADEIVPAVQKNPDYLSEKNMEVVDEKGELVKASRVNWSKSEGYRIRQKPGGDNSLGLVKFMFPNEYNIYIHDTPARSLFEKETRALSHGCIRIQHPDQFARVLLDDPEWSEEKILEAMSKGEEQTVNLDRKIPVVLLYMTFWAGKDGKANFRSDVYGRDATLLKALRSKKSSLDQA
jgi:murein L,D-transpeptidase YcbB/YkuD